MQTGHWLLLALMCAFLLTGGICSDDDDGDGQPPPDDNLNALVDCSSGCLEDFGILCGDLFEVMKRVESPVYQLPLDITYNSTTREFSFDLDLVPDQLNEEETAVSGTIISQSDLTNGMQQGEVAVASLVMTQSVPPDTTGWGEFSFHKLSPMAFRVIIVSTDTLRPWNPFFKTENGCELEFTSFGVHMDTLSYLERDDPFERIYTGNWDFITRTESDDLRAAVFFDGSQAATGSVTYSGDNYPCAVDLNTCVMTVTR